MQYKVRRNIDWHLAKRFSILCIALLSIVIFLFAFFQPIIVPILISVFFAYLLAPVINYFDRFKIPRVIIVSLIITMFIGGIVLISYRVFPLIYAQIIDLLNLVPRAVQAITSKWIPALSDFLVSNGVFDKESFDAMVRDTSIMTKLTGQLQQAVTTIWNTAPKVLGTVVNFVLVPPLTFFLLKDLKPIQNHLAGLVPRDLQSSVQHSLEGINKTLRSVIKGQVMVAGILAVLYVLGLSAVGLNSAVAIGLVAGFCRIVPYLDVLVGGALSLVVLISNYAAPGQMFAVLGVFMLVQSIDGVYITPRVVGERVGLHPMVVILSVFAFADMLGVWGVIIAIPVVALAKGVWQNVIPYYLGSSAYQAAGAKKIQTEADS